MRQITINIPDSQYNFIMQELKKYSFININEEQNNDIPDFHKAIIDRRLENIRKNPTCLLDWDDVEKEIEANL